MPNSLYNRFKEICFKTPNKIAVIKDGVSLSYEELDSKSDLIAKYIRSLKYQKPVGVLFDRSIDLIIAILGILKSGNPYVPLDKSYPKDRLDFMIKKSDTDLIITDDTSFSKSNKKKLIAFDSILKKSMKENTPSNDNAFGELTYIIFTSGSTGEPKGVVMPTFVLENLIDWQIKSSSVKRTLQFAPISFDVSFQEIFSTLCAGGTLILIEENERKDPERLLHLIDKLEIERIFLPAVMLNYMAQIANLNKLYPHSLKEVITAGEQLVITPSIQSFFKILKDCRLFNQYGPSETHVVTSFTLPKEVNRWAELPSIGTAISNVELKILDKNLKPAKKGELFICDPFIAKGYINNPEITNRYFILDPQKEDHRMYATGDIVRLNKNKQLEFLGRKDNQIKVSGYRVESAEVEYLLSKDKNIFECAVCPIVKENSPTYLVAYIVLKNKKAKVSSLKENLQKHAPNYMVPKDFIVIDKLPKTPSGKLNRKALVEKYVKKEESVNDSEKPKLEEIWREILHVDNFDKNQTFFELGGTSLLLLQLYTQISKHFKKKIPIALLLKNNTFNALSDLLEGNEKQEKEDMIHISDNPEKEKIAVIGMVCNFPKNHNPEAFWDFLIAGKESIEFFAPHQDSSQLNPFEHDVYCTSVIDDADLFDAEFFGYSKTEAEMMDPQQRKFLELSWELLEKTGYLNNKATKKIGVFAAQGFSGYLVNNINPNLDYRSNRYFFERFSDLQVMMGGDKDYLPTKVSFKLGLEGPSINVQSACSSSLVAVHLAKQALLNKECELALVGAVNIMSPSKHKYTFQKDMPWSPDGHIRTFDEKSEGMMMAQGLGAVLLKPLSKAIKDKDNILAVISGSGVSNDGNNGKSNFLAPTIDGQVRSLKLALRDANISANKISFIDSCLEEFNL